MSSVKCISLILLLNQEKRHQLSSIFRPSLTFQTTKIFDFDINFYPLYISTFHPHMLHIFPFILFQNSYPTLPIFAPFSHRFYLLKYHLTFYYIYKKMFNEDRFHLLEGSNGLFLSHTHIDVKRRNLQITIHQWGIDYF